MLSAQVHRLPVAAPAHIPEVEVVTELLAHHVFQPDAVLVHLRRSPFAGDHSIQTDVPPEIVGQLLRAPVKFPRADWLEGVVVKEHDATGRATVGRAQRADVDGIGAAVDGVGAAVTGPLYLCGLNGLDDAGPHRVGLGVDDVDAAGAEGRHDQVAPLQVGVRRGRTQRRAARVPVEMVEFVVNVGHRQGVDHLGISCRVGIAVNHGHGVGFAGVGVERRDVGQAFLRSFHRQSCRWIEGGIRSPKRHQIALLS